MVNCTKVLAVLPAAIFLALGSRSLASEPTVTLDHTGKLVGQSDSDSGLTILERTDDLGNGAWSPTFYHLATNEPFTLTLPPMDLPSSFFRLRTQTAPPDPSLVLQLSFDSDFERGYVIDSSGYGNHGLRYGRLCCPTNWPSVTQGPDGSQAGLFRWYADGYGRYGRSGDYIGIPNNPTLQNMTNFTVSAWARFYAAYDGNYLSDHNSTIFNSGNVTPGVWFLGRNFSDYVSFTVYTTEADSIRALSFPDRTVPDGDTHRWNHYAVTFNNGELRGYFNGVCFQTNNLPISALTSAGYYLGVGVWTFNRTPEMELEGDLHPNNGWINGALDDLRIYNRTLTAAELADFYYSKDHQSPTVVTNLSARASGPATMELRWSPAYDEFGVAGYTVRRDGVLLGSIEGHLFVDSDVSPDTTYSYTVEAFDFAEHYSGESDVLSIVTPASPPPLEIIVDDADGTPWVNFVGNWPNDCCWIAGAWEDAWRNDGNEGKGTKSVTFRPQLPEGGEYEVFIRYVQRASFANAVPVDIEHSGGIATTNINHRTLGGRWNSLGRYQFSAGTNATVRIRTEGTSGLVIADAVRFTR